MISIDDAVLKAILHEILDLVGQDSVWAECGADFPRDGCEDCGDYPDCKNQQKLVNRTDGIRLLIEEGYKDDLDDLEFIFANGRRKTIEELEVA